MGGVYNNEPIPASSSQNNPYPEVSQSQLSMDTLNESIGVATFKKVQVAKIQLPDNFVYELEKIEIFYDTYLKDLYPITVGETKINGETSCPIEIVRTQANSSDLVR